MYTRGISRSRCFSRNSGCALRCGLYEHIPPTKMMIASGDMTQLVYYPKSSVVGSYSYLDKRNVFASGENNSPRTIEWWKDPDEPQHLWIGTANFTFARPVRSEVTLHLENSLVDNNPQKGSLIQEACQLRIHWVSGFAVFLGSETALRAEGSRQLAIANC